MKSRWRYDPLFAFRLEHELGLEGSLVIQPASSSRVALGNAGMVFRPGPNGGIVFVEKAQKPDGSFSPAYPVLKPLSFTFLIISKNPGLQSQTEPFASPALPGFSGRYRLFLFDNLDQNNAIDQGLVIPPQPPDQSPKLAEFKMPSQVAAGDEDLASVSPNALSLRAMANQTYTLQVTPIWPGGAPVQNYTVKPVQHALHLKLKSNAYRLSRSAGTPSAEVLFADSELLGQQVFGLIQIFKDASLDYNTSILYRIRFNKI